MDKPYSYQDSLHLLNDSEWNKLGIQNRRSVMQSVENEAAKRDGRQPCNVSIFSEPPSNGMITAGQYNPNTGAIEMNEHYLQRASSNESLITIMHEGRHAYQHRAVKGEISHQDKSQLAAWQNNMKPGHYITAEQNRRAHYRQPIEADAREYASITSRQIQGEQRVQNGANKGIESFREKTANATNNSAKPAPNKGIESFRERAKQGNNGSAHNAITGGKSEGQGQTQGGGQGR